MKQVYRVESGRVVKVAWRGSQRMPRPYRIVLALLRMAEGVKS